MNNIAMNFACACFVTIQICCTASATNTTIINDGNVGCIFTGPLDANEKCCEIFCDVLSERLVDETLASINESCFLLYLTFGNFENWTVQGDWYHGGKGQEVNELRITNCSFLAVESDAFSAKPLRKLLRLSFENINSIKFMNGWVDGLNLVSLTFHNAIVEDLQYNFLLGTRPLEFTMLSSFGKYNVMNVFEQGGQAFVDLNITNAPSIRKISGMHLYRLTMLRLLILNSCGIEIIARNAFIKTRSLERLYLSGNHLKTLPATVFDSILQSRSLLVVHLMNNEWECYCDLLAARDHLTAYELKFNGFPENCPLTESIKPNGAYNREKDCFESEKVTKYKSCEMEIGFNTIFVRYPKFILKADITLSNLMIKSPNRQNDDYFYSIPNHQKSTNWKSEKCSDYQSIPCWIFKNRTESIPLNILNHQNPRTYCFLDSAAQTGIWPYNCVSICKGCNEITNVWLRIPSTLWAAIISIFVGLACISIGTTLGFLLLRLHPKLLRGSERVVILQNTAANRKHSCTIFVMPSDWKKLRQNTDNTRRQRPSSNETMTYLTITSYKSIDYAAIGPVYEFLEFEPPLPPRPN